MNTNSIAPPQVASTPTESPRQAGSLSTSVGRAFDVLELLCKHPNGLRQTDISQALGIPKSSTHALVAVLVERRYLRKDAEKKLYFLGPMTNELGSAYLDNSDLEAAAMPVMNEIQRLTGEVVNLSCRS